MLSLVAVVLPLLPIPPQQGPGWPQYRGPNRDGSVADERWSPHGREEPLWKRSVGKGYSCPSISSGRLVTIGHDVEAGEDRILCLDALSGAEHWRYEFAAEDVPTFHEGGSLTTPTIRDGLVYCLDRVGVLRVLALDDGELRWSKDYAEAFGLRRPFHGFSASPLLDGDRIVLQLGGALAVVAADDGTVLWNTEDRGDRSYSNPARIDIGGRPAIAAVLNMSFVVHDLATGELLHEYPWQLTGNAVHCATPLVLGDRVFLSTAYNKGCAMLKLGESKEPERSWAHRQMRNKVTGCVRHGDHLYGFDESMLRCIDLEGGIHWRVRGLGLGSIAIAGDRLLVLSSDGELIVAEASPDEFRELSRRKVLDGGVYWTMPVLVGGLIYVRNSHGDLVCLDHRVEAAASTAGEQEEPARRAPTAEDLFARHAERIGAAGIEPGRALRLRGTWSIVLRGLEAGAMTWTLVDGDRWIQRLDSGDLVYAYDGDRAWAIEPQGARIVDGDERRELAALFPIRELLAPPCPTGASTAPRPVRFAETACWRVTSPMTGDGERIHYFDTATGRLVGSEGSGLSTLIFQGELRLGDLTLPSVITRFRAEDGQEHAMVLESAEWIEPDETLFAPPSAVQRLLRTPEQLAAATAALRQRFAGATGTYRDEDEGIDCVLTVEDGDLWFVADARDSRFPVDVAAEMDGQFPIIGPPFRLRIEAGQGGRATALVLTIDVGGQEETIRLPRVER